jgi:hypothetical protein
MRKVITLAVIVGTLLLVASATGCVPCELRDPDVVLCLEKEAYRIGFAPALGNMVCLNGHPVEVKVLQEHVRDIRLSLIDQVFDLDKSEAVGRNAIGLAPSEDVIYPLTHATFPGIITEMKALAFMVWTNSHDPEPLKREVMQKLLISNLEGIEAGLQYYLDHDLHVPAGQ